MIKLMLISPVQFILPDDTQIITTELNVPEGTKTRLLTVYNQKLYQGGTYTNPILVLGLNLQNRHLKIFWYSNVESANKPYIGRFLVEG